MGDRALIQLYANGDYSPGDAGVFIADLNTMEVRYGYGYAPDESAASAWTFIKLEN